MQKIGKKHIGKLAGLFSKLGIDWLCFYTFEFILNGFETLHHFIVGLISFDTIAAKMFFILVILCLIIRNVFIEEL